MDIRTNPGEVTSLSDAFCLETRSKLLEQDTELRRADTPWKIIRKIHNKQQATNAYILSTLPTSTTTIINNASFSPSFNKLSPPASPSPSSSSNSILSSPSSSSSSINLDIPYYIRVDSELKCAPYDLYKYYIVENHHTCKEFNDSILNKGTLYKSLNLTDTHIEYILSKGGTPFVPNRQDINLTFYNQFEDTNNHYYSLSIGLDNDIVPDLQANSSYVPMSIKRKKLVRSKLYFSSIHIKHSQLNHNHSNISHIYRYDPMGGTKSMASPRNMAGFVANSIMKEHQRLALKFSHL